MPKRLTKTQKKRLVTDILKKTKKLYMDDGPFAIGHHPTVDNKDMSDVERMCKKWMKRVG